MEACKCGSTNQAQYGRCCQFGRAIEKLLEVFHLLIEYGLFLLLVFEGNLLPLEIDVCPVGLILKQIEGMVVDQRALYMGSPFRTPQKDTIFVTWDYAWSKLGAEGNVEPQIISLALAGWLQSRHPWKGPPMKQAVAIPKALGDCWTPEGMVYRELFLGCSKAVRKILNLGYARIWSLF